MIDKSRQIQLKRLLSEAVLLLCRNGLPIDSQFSIEAMIGITLGEDEVFLVSFRETVESSLTETSSGCHSKERADEIAKYSDTDCDSRKNANGVWTKSASDVCGPVQQLEEIDDPDQEMAGGDFCYEAGFDNHRYGLVIKSEVDQYPTEYSADFPTGTDDLSNGEEESESCQYGDFEGKVKSESHSYGLDGFERSVYDSSHSKPSCRKPMSSAPSSSFTPLTNLKGRTRSQTVQRSTGSRYSTSSDQRPRAPVYLESGESVTSVEKLLSAIYPSADNRSLRCHVCGAELKCRRTLMEHIRGTHLSIHSYHCPDCGLGFKWRSSLKHHRARNCTLPTVLAAAAAYDFRPLAR